MTLSVRLGSIFLAIILLTATISAAAQDEDAFGAISAEVEGIRQLELRAPLDLRFISREELMDELQGDLLEEEDAAARADDQRILVALGFLEPGDNPQELYVALLGEQVAGYYDPETNEMVVVISGDGEELTALEEVTFAHETVHALQDQHFDLETFNDVRMEGTDDAALAVTALIEGDASLAEVDYLLADMSLARAYLDEIDEMSGGMDVLNSTPPYLVRTLSFPYNEGFMFAQYLFDEGGWDLVNAAFENPPTTTEQILHPETYLDGEEAIPVTVPDVADVLGSDWRTIEDNSMGEFIISLLLSDSQLDEDQIEAAHTGWGGDAYTAATDGDDTVVAWVSEWDSEEDADEFVQALVARESERLGLDVAHDDDVITLAGDEVVVQVIQDGSHVTYIQGPDVASVSAMVAATDG